ncbi:HTH domain-containing protein [Flavobacterium sp. UBA7682]|uniref:HTH domain-containing protein n=1 Tax=Flavobacterium sp. UBA7682 TaxID=1946560 RepID=UPI0025B9D75C|nr:HTH domain-containing protein [Flavobacterium sp. UBA7682]
MDIRVVIKIHELLKANRAGNSNDISLKLGISVRSVYNYLTFMKTELNAPIAYSHQTKNYCYERECELNFRG